MSVRVEDFDLGGGCLEACYFGGSSAGIGPALAVQADLDPLRRRMWELVSYGLASGPYHAVGKVYLFPVEITAELIPLESDPLVVRALRSVLWAMEPDWLARASSRCISENPHVVAAWCGLPLEVVLAAGAEVI